MAGHREFQTATEHRAMQRYHHRSVLGFQPRQQGVEGLGGKTLGIAERRDVGACHEGAPGAVQHQGVQVIGGLEAGQRLAQAGDERAGDGIDRRVVDQDQADACGLRD